MAKAAAKSITKTQTTETPTSRAPRAKASGNNNIEKASEDALQKLQELGINDQLQRDLEWCLGSYRADQNPIGLYENARKALEVLKNEKDKKTKGVTAKFITDLEKAVKDHA